MGYIDDRPVDCTGFDTCECDRCEGERIMGRTLPADALFDGDHEYRRDIKPRQRNKRWYDR